jgi:hypothetical protein
LPWFLSNIGKSEGFGLGEKWRKAADLLLCMSIDVKANFARKEIDVKFESILVY